MGEAVFLFNGEDSCPSLIAASRVSVEVISGEQGHTKPNSNFKNRFGIRRNRQDCVSGNI